MNLKTALGTLRLLALLEGISFLSFIITMPLKYMLDYPMPNKIVGMLHGFLFIAYVFFVFIVGSKNWSKKEQFLAYLASLVPAGTFIVDAKIFRSKQS
jgi:integral membrane protein